jgi:hypothetical protein
LPKRIRDAEEFGCTVQLVVVVRGRHGGRSEGKTGGTGRGAGLCWGVVYYQSKAWDKNPLVTKARHEWIVEEEAEIIYAC